MASDYDRLRQAQREALDRVETEPQPDAETARRNAEERVQSSVGPAPGMVQNNQWANDYDKRVQAHQAERHTAEQDQAIDTPAAPEQSTGPTGQEKIEARRGLNDKHAAARTAERTGGRDVSDSLEPDRPEQEKHDIDQYRRAEREVTDREQGSERPSPLDEYRRDFCERSLDR